MPCWPNSPLTTFARCVGQAIVGTIHVTVIHNNIFVVCLACIDRKYLAL